MRIPALSVAVLLLLFASSCKKDSTFQLDISARYKKTGLLQTGPTRLFTPGGEIKTSSIIAKFEDRDEDWLDAIAKSLFPQTGRIDTIRVSDAENIYVHDNYQYTLYGVSAKGNNSTLIAKDTTTGMSYYEVYTRTIQYNICLYKPPVFSEYLVSSTRGVYGFGYTTRHQYYLEQEGEGFRLPWITGVFHGGNGSTSSITIQNKIDPDFYKTLAAGDTVVIREYAVSYKK
jgi:hypothetical protein